MNNSDGQLLERFAASHDEAAFATLVQRLGPMVLGTCKRILRDPHLAEDAFQATFLILARKAGGIRETAILTHWLHRVARNVSFRLKSQTTRQAHLAQQLAQVSRSGTKPGGDDEGSDATARLDDAIARLPAKFRLPILLCYLQGKTHADAARDLSCTEDAVRGRLFRGRDMLRRKLARQTSPAAAISALSLHGMFTHPLGSTLATSTAHAATAYAAGGTTVATSVVGPYVVGLAKSTMASMATAKTLTISGLTAAAALVLTVGMVLTMNHHQPEPRPPVSGVVAASVRLPPPVAIHTAVPVHVIATAPAIAAAPKPTVPVPATTAAATAPDNHLALRIGTMGDVYVSTRHFEIVTLDRKSEFHFILKPDVPITINRHPAQFRELHRGLMTNVYLRDGEPFNVVAYDP